MPKQQQQPPPVAQPPLLQQMLAIMAMQLPQQQPSQPLLQPPLSQPPPPLPLRPQPQQQQQHSQPASLGSLWASHGSSDSSGLLRMLAVDDLLGADEASSRPPLGAAAPDSLVSWRGQGEGLQAEGGHDGHAEEAGVPQAGPPGASVPQLQQSTAAPPLQQAQQGVAGLGPQQLQVQVQRQHAAPSSHIGREEGEEEGPQQLQQVPSTEAAAEVSRLESFLAQLVIEPTGPPAGTWQALHQLFDKALRGEVGIDNRPVRGVSGLESLRAACEVRLIMAW